MQGYKMEEGRRWVAKVVGHIPSHLNEDFEGKTQMVRRLATHHSCLLATHIGRRRLATPFSADTLQNFSWSRLAT